MRENQLYTEVNIERRCKDAARAINGHLSTAVTSSPSTCPLLSLTWATPFLQRSAFTTNGTVRQTNDHHKSSWHDRNSIFNAARQVSCFCSAKKSSLFSSSAKFYLCSVQWRQVGETDRQTDRDNLQRQTDAETETETYIETERGR